MPDKNCSKFKILDCTIRDGGYLNNWDFDKKFVKELYRNLSRTGVDIIEIGLRNIQEKDVGIWYSTPEELVHELFDDTSGADLALLVDYGKVDLNLIPDASNSRISVYRVACHKDKVHDTIKLCEEIKQKGYQVSLQLMGIVTYTVDEIAAIIKPISQSNIDYVYFADSYGSLFPHDIKKYVSLLKLTNKKVGFHPHNNLQLAFANTLEAIRNGIDIVDGTVYGMGRGAGNLPLESLIIYLEKTLKQAKYNSLPVLDLVDRYFSKLKEKIGWGYNLPYMLSGVHEVHPYFAKNMMEQYQYTVDDMVKALEVVKDIQPVGYSKKLMDEIINSGFISPLEAEETDHDNSELQTLLKSFPVEYKDRHMGRDFLILANGPSLKENKEEVEDFIERFNPVVMGGNYLGGLFKPDYHAFSNKKRFIQYIESVDEKSKLLLSTIFEDEFIRDYTKRDYERLVHLNRISSKFEIVDGVVTSTCRTISMLLVAVAIIMGARRIFIAGMDGYKSKDNFISNNVHFYEEPAESNAQRKSFRAYLELHNWNELLLNKINDYLLTRNKDGLHIITPTSHKHFYNSFENWRA